MISWIFNEYFIIIDLNTVLNHPESHFCSNRSATLQEVRSRFSLIPEKLVNEDLNEMMNVIFPSDLWHQNKSKMYTSMAISPITIPSTTSPKINPIFSRTPSINMSFEENAENELPVIEPWDNYESILLNNGLMILFIYFDEEGKFPESSRFKSKIPTPFAKDGKVVSSREICQYFNENNVSILFVNN